MSDSNSFTIAIIGGGIAGLSLAISLHKRNISVAIYEQASKFGEIGAGVAFTPNAVQAMKICDQGIYEAFEKVATKNQWESKKDVWFDFLDGMERSDDGSARSGHQEAVFQHKNSIGQNGVHRARFLEEMVKLVPDSIARFGKRLDDIEEGSDGQLRMRFCDGSTAEADAVIGCDGIKSAVRGIIVGKDHPSAKPVYTHKYAYRGLIPMEKAVGAIGEERAQNACLHMGQDGHVLTFPVDHGKTLNLVAFRTNSKDWPNYSKTTMPAKRDDALKDYEGFGPNVIELIKLTNPDLDCWAIFDLGDHPVSTFYKGRICISGDAAHATSPHHGAGAGFCIEDSAVLASLVADPRVKTHKDLEAAFATFDSQRRERTQWLVQHSRRQGDLYEWRAEGVGKDFKKLEREINESNAIIAEADVDKMCEAAKEELGVRIS